MLSSADAELAARDPEVPGLATLLDPEALTDRLHRSLGRADFEVGPVQYVKYQPGKNCLAGYELRNGPFRRPFTLQPIDSMRYTSSTRLVSNTRLPARWGPGRRCSRTR